MATQVNGVFLAVGIALTVFIVNTNLDAWWFQYWQGTNVYDFFSLAGPLGFFVPILVWGILLAAGMMRRDHRMKMAAWMTAQAGIFGIVLSSLLKAFTGRLPPPQGAIVNVLEQSHGFQLGVLKGGIFWGWPSSHTTTAFALALSLAVYYREKKWVVVIAIAYAAYIGIGASFSFHWLSDVVMGVILGSLIGIAVGRGFVAKEKST